MSNDPMNTARLILFNGDMIRALKEIYAIRGEDAEIARICNEVLPNE